jgi:hypothetical protein
LHGNYYGSWNLSSKCLPYPHQELGETRVTAKWIPYKLNDDQTAMCALAATHLLHWRYEAKAFLDRILMVDVSWTHLFDSQLKQQNAE